MNKAIKRKWVAALRSGKYKQGGGELRYERDEGDIRHCCLGVLCEVMGEAIEYGMSLPPEHIAKEAGLSFDVDEAAASDAKTLAPRLAGYNDDGRSFKWIASYIERYL